MGRAGYVALSVALKLLELEAVKRTRKRRGRRNELACPDEHCYGRAAVGALGLSGLSAPTARTFVAVAPWES